MNLRHTLIYVGQAVILGLAIAFVITRFLPDENGTPAIDNPGSSTKVEIRQAAPTPVASSLPASGPASYAAAVDAAAPAVVNINTAKVVTVRPHPFFNDPVFRNLFGEDLDRVIKPKKQVQNSLGSGVIVSGKGLILTNHHVIKGADAIQVSLRDGRSAEAKVIGSDPETDLAVLRIDLPDLPSITMGHSDKLRVGDVVLAIGNPFGVGQTVTMGIVSATGRTKLGINTFENFIQTDAAINPGNSGGALVDVYGNLVGINTAIFSKSGGSQGIGFAIPESLAQSVLSEIVEYGRPRRGWLGIEGEPVTTAMASELGMDKPRGILVIGVLRNGPAHVAGIEPGDVILAIDGMEINDPHAALINISSQKPGTTIEIAVFRNGKVKTIRLKIVERPLRRPG